MKRFYQSLKLCRSLIQFETKLLDVAGASKMAGGERQADKEKRR
jgi:hypothetical protein